MNCIKSLEKNEKYRYHENDSYDLLKIKNEMLLNYIRSLVTKADHKNIISLENYMLKKENEKLLEGCYLDELTGSYNRRYLKENADEFKEKDNVIVILDIDDFKVVNDSYGHLVGDKVLKETVRCLKKNLRKDDIVCRYGGEEFVIILKNLTDSQSYDKINNLRKKIKNMSLFNDDLNKFSITCSFGFRSSNGDLSFDQLLSKADKALLFAKANGKDIVINERI